MLSGCGPGALRIFCKSVSVQHKAPKATHTEYFYNGRKQQQFNI